MGLTTVYHSVLNVIVQLRQLIGLIVDSSIQDLRHRQALHRPHAAGARRRHLPGHRHPAHGRYQGSSVSMEK